MRTRWLHTALAIGSAFVPLSCTPVPLGDGEKRVVVREIATLVILPTQDELVSRAEVLTTTAQQLSSTPSEETLDSARDAWRAARLPWKEAEAFAFGPATDLRIAAAIDQSPIEPSKIDLEISGTSSISAAHVEGLGANGKGFHAVEYLLFRTPDDGAVLASFTTDVYASRRCELLVAFAQNLQQKAAELQSAWAMSGGNYVSELAEPGASNGAYPTIKASIDTLVNESVFLSELVANDKIGKPLGTASGGTPQPELEESGPSDNSVADMAANLRSIQNSYFGTRSGMPGKGISQLVRAQSAATDQGVRQALAEAIRTVAAIPRPYRSAVTEHRAAVEEAQLAVKALKRIFATEVIAVLGATLKFNDNDGD